MPTYAGNSDFEKDEWPYENIPEGDTKEDWIAWVPAINNCCIRS